VTNYCRLLLKQTPLLHVAGVRAHDDSDGVERHE